MTISETSKGKARRSTLYKLKQLNRNAPNSLNQVKNEKMGAGVGVGMPKTVQLPAQNIMNIIYELRKSN